jgi:hypothetical protein
MAFTSFQVATSATLAVPLYTFETEETTAYLQSGSANDPVPICIFSTSNIYVGGPGVTSSNGYLLLANVPFPMTVLGNSEVLYVAANSGTPTVYVILGRQ